MNSRQGSRYIKNRMGNELKTKILVQNGIISEKDIQKQPLILVCGRCQITNALENRYCSKCSYPLKPEAYDDIKVKEEIRIKEIEEKHSKEIQTIREEMYTQFNQIISIIQQNPVLAQVKPEALTNKKIL
jgi:integrase/recombinase XerD